MAEWRENKPKNRAIDEDMQVVLDIVSSAKSWAKLGVWLAVTLPIFTGAILWFLNATGWTPVTQKEFQASKAEQAKTDLEQTQILDRLSSKADQVRWELLHMRARNGTINIEERIEYCRLSAELRLPGTGCI